MSKVILLLPAYNEAENIGTLVERAAAVFDEYRIEYRVVAVDDGSTDGTAAELARLTQRFPVSVVSHLRNRGLGETIRDGVEAALEGAHDDDVIVRMDGDNTHDPKYIPAMIDKLHEGCDVVIASRFQPGGDQLGVPRNRAAFSRLANLFMKAVFPMRGVREYSCGYRAYRAGALRHVVEKFGRNFIQLGGFGFCCTLEKLVKLHLLGARIGEIAFVHRYDLKLGASKMVANVTTLGYLVMTLLHYWPWGGWRRSYSSPRERITPRPAVTPLALFPGETENAQQRAA